MRLKHRKFQLMKITKYFLFAALTYAGQLEAAVITGGTATWTVNEGFASSLGWLDSNFSASKTRAQVLSEPATGDASYNRITGSSGTLGNSTTMGVLGTPGQVQVVDTIRPFGEVPLNDAGGTTPGTPGSSRTRQATTLNFDPSNILGTWSTSNDGFAFTGGSVLGEQIAFTSMQRWGGPFTGSLVYGDFALRYNTGGQLVLTSNIDFLNAEFVVIGNPVFNYTGDAASGTLTLSGDLLVGEGLWLLDNSATIGQAFGNFNLTASVIPEPSTWALLGSGALLLGLLRRRRDE